MWSQVDKQVLESCLGVCALALSVVLAGSGNLDTLRLLRGTESPFPSQGTPGSLNLLSGSPLETCSVKAHHREMVAVSQLVGQSPARIPDFIAWLENLNIGQASLSMLLRIVPHCCGSGGSPSARRPPLCVCNIPS